ncbi:hypothetical protein BC332_33506 [Capsicum chinense]|nr:hypothetical protein BC332_33506 [Capsicum chinense]
MEILGIRFHPRDEELIRYLLKFVSCKNYSCDNIRFEDLYGNQKPWEIFESNSSGDDEDAKKELGDYMPMEIPSGDEVVAAMDGTLLKTQQHDSCLLNPFTSSEHNNVFHKLQQDQNSEQLINQMQTIDEMVFSA